MQVQPALYNGHEIVKTNHALTVVHDSEDTLDIAEITRKKMLEKMKSPLYIQNLTPKPISKMTVYPPNTPAKLVPGVLPTKSQVKINIYTLTQLFTKFDKTCKKRITPCGLTEGEMGFEQIKECYLTKVITFFKTLKEYFEGIQTALFKEVKEIFEQMEAEVEQNAVDKQCADIEMKNLLIENENLIAACLSNELLYSVMNALNTVSRFFEMHDAYTVEQARCLKLEAEISKLKHKIEKDDHGEMIKHFSNLEIDHLNLQLKYQNLKEFFGNNKSQTSQDTLEFDSFFEINKMKEKLQGKNNTISKLKEKIYMNERRSEADHILDFKALDSQNIEIKEHVTALQDQNERFRAENEKVKQHYKELYDSIKITCAKTIENTSSLSTKNEKLKAQLKGKMVIASTMPYRIKSKTCLPLESVAILCEIVEEARIEKPLDNALENACFYTKRSQELLEYVIGTYPKEIQVKSSTEASGSKPRSNTKNNKILPAKSDNKKKVEDHSRFNKLNLKQKNHVDSSISSKLCCEIFEVCTCPPPLLVKSVMSKVKQVWKATGKLFANIGYQWKPTGRKFTLGEQCPLARFTKSKVVPLKQPEHVSSNEIVITKRSATPLKHHVSRYKHRNKKGKKAISLAIPTTAVSQTN
ncbi:hypothetical protein Tco_0758737 [Tanacetum coccineum]